MSAARRGRPPTKAKQVEAALRQHLAAGRWGAGAMLPGEHDLCRELTVSRMCLRTALQALEADGLISRHHGKGTMVTGSSSPAGTIAIILPDATIPEEQSFQDQIARGIRIALQDSALAAGYQAIAPGQCLSDIIAADEDRARSWSGVFTIGHYVDPPAHAWLQAAGIAITTMSAPGHGLSLPSVDVDNETGGRLAIEHLLERGYRRPLVIDSVGTHYGDDRRRGIIAALEQAGITDHDHVLQTCPEIHHRRGQQACRELVAPYLAAATIDSIYVYMEHPTIGAYQAIADAGLQVGRDIGLVHYNDYPWLCDVLRPQPTALRQPFEAVACTAIQVLLAQIAGEAVLAGVRTIVPELIVREST